MAQHHVNKVKYRSGARSLDEIMDHLPARLLPDLRDDIRCARVQRRGSELLCQRQSTRPHVRHKNLPVETLDITKILNEQETARAGAGDQDISDWVASAKLIPQFASLHAVAGVEHAREGLDDCALSYRNILRYYDDVWLGYTDHL